MRQCAEVNQLVLAEYWPVLLFIGVATGLGIALLLIGFLLGPSRPESDKLSPYECGFEAFEDARMRFDVRYYLLAILFIIFDLEIAFLFPWAVVFQKIGIIALIEMALFLLLLVIGFRLRVEEGSTGMGVISSIDRVMHNPATVESGRRYPSSRWRQPCYSTWRGYYHG